MIDTLTVKILFKDQVKEIKDVQSLHIPGVQGAATILPKHATMVFALSKGAVSVQPMNKTFAIEKGFLKVENNLCTLILFTTCAPPQKDISLPKVDDTFERCLSTVLARTTS
jgi:F0F1-type ATP synthase epsilon subunit